MSRRLRVAFPGAVYHVTSRGDRCEPIYRDDEDRVAYLEVIAPAMDRFDAGAGLLPDGQPLPLGNAYRTSQPVAVDATRQWRVHAGVQPAS